MSLAHLPTVNLLVEYKFMQHVGTVPVQVLIEDSFGRVSSAPQLELLHLFLVYFEKKKSSLLQ